jgi:mevalonate kinase
VVLEVETFGDRYSIVPRAPRVARHPLLEAAIDAYPPPRGLAVVVSVRSDVPAGCGTGTSAAVAVALLGGLAALRRSNARRATSPTQRIASKSTLSVSRAGSRTS